MAIFCRQWFYSICVLCFAATASAWDNLQFVYDARTQIGVTTRYDGSYHKLDYPMGDIPLESGVCTDVIIRAMRSQSIDLQQLVHEDMKQYFAAYPHLWGMKSTDRNIDHRRVPNLEVFFRRHGQTLPLDDKSTFIAGDIVTWRLPANHLPHIGIVSDHTAEDGTPLIIHNIGRGTQEENVLFSFSLHGHYCYPKS
ncbi:MAG: DUF1287 domain-containing protein [Cardiobacteriaceae bacterium]|nr:DUF1287 domain-containing protein [Cardiobacteriaceae bacterium]